MTAKNSRETCSTDEELSLPLRMVLRLTIHGCILVITGLVASNMKPSLNFVKNVKFVCLVQEFSNY